MNDSANNIKPSPEIAGPSWRKIIIASVLVFALIFGGFIFVTFSKTWFAPKNPLPTFSTNWIGPTEVARETPDDRNTIVNPSIPTDKNTLLNKIPISGSETKTLISQGFYDTSKWLTFDSRKLPIKFSYPHSWNIWSGTTPLSENIQIADYPQPQAEDGFLDPGTGHRVEIVLMPQPTDRPLETWIRQNNPNNLFDTTEDILVDGFPAKIHTTFMGITFTVIYIPLGDGSRKMITFSLFGPEKTIPEIRPLIEAFISTISIKGE